jgi:HSP20 family protein
MRSNPTEELSIWHRDIDELFGRFFGRNESSVGSWVPRIETARKDNEFVVRLDVPGVDPKDIDIRAEGNLLTITGERKTEEKNADYQETCYGKFERTLSLPQGVETDKIAAHYQHGVLEVRVPVPAQHAGGKVSIKIEQKDNKKRESKAA